MEKNNIEENKLKNDIHANIMALLEEKNEQYKDFDEKALAEEMTKLIQDNYTSLYGLAGELVDCERGQFEDIKWVNNEHAWPDRIYGLNLSEKHLEEKMAFIVEGMKSGQLPSKIGTNVLTKPENYEHYFTANGIEKAFDSTGMVLNMDEINQSFQPKIHIEIQKVTKDLQLYEFAQLVTRYLFNKTDDKIEPYYNCMKALLDGGHITCYMAYHDGEAVATSMSYGYGDVLGIYHVSTKAEYRSNGIGKQMTLQPVLDGKMAGFKKTVLFATALGKPVYEKVGFKAMCPLSRYKLKA